MKRRISFILFVMITASFLYTVLGYYLLFTFEKEQVWVKTLNQIPNTEYKILHINASLYTFTEDTDFEYVNENIEIKGVVYHVFKKKTKDNITSFYYLKNKQQNSFDLNLKKLADDSVFSDLPINKKPLAKLLKSFIKDYVFKSYAEPVFTYKTILQESKCVASLEKPIHTGYLLDFFVPPKRA